MEIEKELEAMMHAGKPEARSTEAEQTQISKIEILLPEAPTTKASGLATATATEAASETCTATRGVMRL